MSQSPPKQNQDFQFPEVRVVEASAGSGKTYALSKRYLQLILKSYLSGNKLPIKNVLAITFTNKSAFEMKSRILQFLKLIAFDELNDVQSKDVLGPIGVKSEVGADMAYKVMDEVILHYNYFQVQTIDKFINALLSGCALKIGLTANFQIRTDTKDYLEYSLDELIDQARTDKPTYDAFKEFLNHYLYLENRSGWFPKDDMLSILVSLFSQNSSYGLDFKESNFQSKDLIKSKKQIVGHINELKEMLPAETNKGFVKSIDKFIEQSVKGFDIDSISDYFAREEVPVNKGVDISTALSRKWSTIQKDIIDLCLEESACLFDPYINVFNRVMDGFSELAKRNDCLFLSELNKRAAHLFDEDHITVEEMYYRLATRYQHYLIDEFQDTSRLQWNNLDNMVEEALSTGGSLFYVGDKKQAIYSFRGGDATLFEDVKERFEAFNVHTDLLVKNWRSQKQIVEFNNTIFSSDNLERFIHGKHAFEESKRKKNIVEYGVEDIEQVKQNFHSSNQSFLETKEGGYVHLEYVDVDKKDERDEYVREKVYAIMDELKKRYQFRDIAFLTRSNTEVELLTQWLLEANIPIESERTSNITENQLIEELVVFLTFLNSPIDNLSFTRFVTSDLFIKATGLNRSDMEAFLFSLRPKVKGEENFYIYREFREKFSGIWEQYIHEFFSNIGLFPLYELVVSIYKQYDIFNQFPDQQGFFMHFLELIKEQEEEHYDVQSFLEYFDNLIGENSFVHITDQDAVKVLTIHKSKGLEFPVVIIPFLGMDIQIGTGADNKQSYLMRDHGDHRKLLRLKAKYYQFSEDLKAIYDEEYKKALINELNNLYVALTRAEIELYGFIPKRVGNSQNLAVHLIGDLCGHYGKNNYKHTHSHVEADVKTLPAAQFHDWVTYLSDEFGDVDGLDRRDVKMRGIINHSILSYIGNLKNVNKEEVLHKAVAMTKSKFVSCDNLEVIAQNISQLVDTDQIKPFFYVDDGEILTEKEYVNKLGHSKRMDRVIITNDKVIVVDFKSHNEGLKNYTQQLKEYRQLLGEIYPKKQIESYLVFCDSYEVNSVE